jgi:hypothetical protein
VNAIQRFSTSFPNQVLLAFAQQPGCRRVAFQDAYILVHHKNRHRHGIEQHSMESLI